MVTLAMLYWVGYKLYAPDWYWWCWGIAAFLNVIQFGINCYKKGQTL